MTQIAIALIESHTDVIGPCDAYVRVFQSKQLYAVETLMGQWYVINSKKNRYVGRCFDKLPFRSNTVIPVPLYRIDSIFPKLKEKLVLTSWLLEPEQQ